MTLPDIAFACILALAALLAQIVGSRARAAARAYLRFAAILYFALAISDIAAAWFVNGMTTSLAHTATLLVCALAPASLALGVFGAFETPPRAWIAALVLALVCVVAFVAAISFSPALAFTPLFCSVCVILALSVRRWRKDGRSAFTAIIAALCFLAGAACSLTQGPAARTALALFSAAGLLGFSLALTRRSHARVGVQREKSGPIPVRARR